MRDVLVMTVREQNPVLHRFLMKNPVELAAFVAAQLEAAQVARAAVREDLPEANKRELEQEALLDYPGRPLPGVPEAVTQNPVVLAAMGKTPEDLEIAMLQGLFD